ncbi:hypothetical+protein [Methylocapsa aurea]|uniref:hypothetical protein n=1 Tax=Methylocapsa aurea TaxID=663610 RepID=UPI003D18926F
MSEKFHPAIFKLVNSLGWRYTQKSIADVAAHLEAEGFVFTETDDIVSPSGEFFGAAVGRLWEEGPPAGGAKAVPAGARHPNGLTDADIAAIKDPQRRLEVLAEVEGGCRVVPSWQRSAARPATIGEIAQRTGLTAEAFAALPPDRKIEIENEVKFARNGGAQ